MAAPNPFPLSSLNGTTGFRLSGVAAGDNAGWSVSDAGDVNGDGFADVIMSATSADNGGNTNAGVSYVVFGATSGFASNLNLSSLNGSTGFRILGVSVDEQSGSAVSAAGDLNGDGFADLIIGSPNASPNGITGSGISYVVFGASTFTSSLSLSALNGSNGFRLAGVGALDKSGWSVSSAGDVNGDGFDDLIVGAYRARVGNVAYYGASYVVFGKASGFTSRLNLSALSGSDGFRIVGGHTHDYAGFSVSGGGDINGDGFADLIVGANGASPNGVAYAGVSYVVFGKGSGLGASIDLTSLDGSNGFRLSGKAGFDNTGFSVSNAGDVNGDGLDDLIVGAPDAESPTSNAGVSYVVFGATSFASDLALSALNGSNGFRLAGIGTGDRSGFSVSGAGDFNADGYADLIVSAPKSSTSTGAAYLLYGKASGFASNINLSALSGSDGFKLTGANTGDYAGSAVSGAGDVNGDGYDDLIVGARTADPNTLADSGAGYVIFGSSSGTVTHAGGTGADTLAGSAAADVMVGGRGNDTLTGNGGADAFNGGADNDLIVVPDTAFRLVDGGTGIDTLRLSGGGQTFDLPALADNRITGIEVIDITGSGNNTLVLSAGDLFNLADTGNTLRVDANAGDLVATRGTWTLTGTTTLNARTYDVYTLGAATLQVDATANVFTGQVQLSALDGSNGFMLHGVLTSDQSGLSVSDAGDVNGDGYADLIIGAPIADVNGNADAGAAYVVFGAGSGFASSLSLSALNGSNGFRLAGLAVQDNAGRSVSGAGDINGDGFADLVVGAPQFDAGLNVVDNGGAFVVFGKASGFASSLSLSGLSGSTGFQLTGGADVDNAGRSVHGAGDVNGDGYDDLIVGAYNANAPGATDGGISYVVFGNATGFASSLNLGTLNGGNGFQLAGVGGGDQSGVSTGSAGDFNGDGYDDLIIGARFADLNAISNSGAAYMVFGRASGFASRLDLSSLDGNNGFRMAGEITQSRTGFSVSSAGDINGDGLDDILVGAYNVTGGGASYVVFGAVTGLGATLDLSALDGSRGFKLPGPAVGAQSGMSVSAAGDINADGYDDLIIGAQGADLNGNNSGASYVIFGKAGGFGASVALSALDGTDGFQLLGAAATDYAGRSVSGAGDVNGDGFDDLIVSAPSADPNAVSAAGTSYVVFGGNFTGMATHTGTSGADALAGTAGADVMVGGQGNDTLTGNGGADVFNGGAGNDRIVVADPTFRQIDGGAGTDTLTFAGSGLTLDLSALPGNRVAGIEVIDLTGSGNNKLRLAASDVLDLSDSGNALRVDGNAGDVLVRLGTWTAAGSTQIDNQSYRVYTQGAVTLQVDADVGIAFPDLRLSSLDGSNGFRLAGVAAGDESGSSVSSAGDFNGDGFDDVIVGARMADPNSPDSGASYLVFGRASGFTANLNLAALDGTNGFRLAGVAASDFSGAAVSDAGDVNGDGFGDLIVGAMYADPNGASSGASYVVFGRASGFTANLSLSALDGTNGFRLAGVAAGDQSGNAVSNAGDLNGDGFDDLIVGARTADPNSPDAGASYVLYGRASGFAANLDLSALDGTNGFRLPGLAAFDQSGFSVSNAGDVNGDGFDDLVVGAPRADPNGPYSGISYLVFGRASGFAANLNLSALDGNNGFRLTGAAAGEISGESVSAAGDVNGDGFDDLIVGARLADPNGSDSGASYVVFGRVSGFAADLSLSALDGSNGFRLAGVATGDQSGTAVSSAGDLNGDGFDDLIVGAMYADPNGTSSGASYVVFGQASGFASSLNLSALDGANGFRLAGAAGVDLSGNSVSNAGDLNGDGFDDLIVGAFLADPNGGQSGAGYVVFGGNFSGAVTRAGTASADNLAGTAGADVMVGGQGNDTLTGNGGADVFNGGAGDDRIVIADLTFRQVDGGSGADTLALSGSGQTLDLTTLASNKITGIEVIDLTGSGNNTLRLGADDVLDLPGSGNTLRVDGDAGDMLIRGGFWTPAGGTSINNQSYQVFTQGAATLQVATAVTVLAELQLSALDGGNGFRLAGVTIADQSGFAVSGAGDVNGDGFGDMIVGAATADPNGSNSGASYVVFGRASGISSNLNLSTLDGTNGFRLAGVATSDLSGASVSSAGDLNGDGFDDMIIGARYADPNGSNSGATYVVFGRASGFAATLNLSALDGSNGFRLAGAAAGDNSGFAVSNTGDVNGDGFGDLIIGAARAAPNGSNSGASYVVFGRASGFAANLNLSALDGTNGFRLAGVAAGDQSGSAVGNAGDVNGDGLDDLIVGARFASPNGIYSGASYVVFGRASGFAANLSLSALDGTNGFRLAGEGEGGRSGTSVSSAGDVNGDGFDDLIVGAPAAGPIGLSAGVSYVVFGRASGFAASLNLSALDGSTGFRLTGATYNLSGVSVSNAGDINGDGFDDLIVGAHAASPNGQSSGASYVVFGRASGFAANLSVSALDGTNGFRLAGVAAHDNSGNSVSNAGDLNGDGFDDLIVGARYADANGSDSGAGYVVFGGNFTGAVTHVGTAGADDLAGSANADVMMGGLGNDTLAGGDAADLLKGGTGNDLLAGGAGSDSLSGGAGADSMDGGSGFDTADYTASASAVFVNLATNINTGGDAQGDLLTEVENLAGSPNNDTLTGDAGANNIAGGAGNDTLSGAAGSDTLDGGAGIDTLSYANAGAATFVELWRGAASNDGDGSSDTFGNFEHLTGSAFNDILIGSGIADLIDAGNGIDRLAGLEGNDTLLGGAGDDYIDGGTGADSMVGGAGGDFYLVDNPGDSIVENPGDAGFDYLVSYVTRSIDANVEAMIMDGGASAFGNALDNALYGNFDNAVNTLTGGTGNDVYLVGAGDVVVENASEGTWDYIHAFANHTLEANVEAMIMYSGAAGTGNNADNSLYGNYDAAANVLTGLDGNDTYILGAGDSVVETSTGGAWDFLVTYTTHTLEANVEAMILDNGANGFGNAQDNALYGNFDPAANILTGGDGSDVYNVGAGDVVVEAATVNAGSWDFIFAYAAHTLEANVEAMIMLNGATGTGNAQANTLYGTYDGAANLLIGGDGDDTFVVSAGDTVQESANQGTDTVVAFVSFTLPGEVENLSLSGTDPINATGNAVANLILGNGADNTIAGGLGNDRLFGGAGVDRFVFDTTPNAATNMDVITDFSPGTDKIVLDHLIFTDLVAGNLPAGQLITGNGAFSTQADDFLVYDSGGGNLFYDAGGAGGASPVWIAHLDNSPALTAADFSVV